MRVIVVVLERTRRGDSVQTPEGEAAVVEQELARRPGGEDSARRTGGMPVAQVVSPQLGGVGPRLIGVTASDVGEAAAGVRPDLDREGRVCEVRERVGEAIVG